MPRRGQRGAALVLAALSASVGTAATAATPAHAFSGATLVGDRIGLTFDGTAYPRIACPAYTAGFCRGRVTILRRGRVLGRAPLALRSNDRAGVQVPMRGRSRRAVMAGGRRVTVVIATQPSAAGDVRTWRTRTHTALLSG